MSLREDSQAGLFDREIESDELEGAIEDYLNTQEDAKANAKAKKTIKSVTEQYDLREGERLRVGRFVIVGKRRSGGGFEVPAWSKVTAGKINPVD